jgi:hypothetical protein
MLVPVSSNAVQHPGGSRCQMQQRQLRCGANLHDDLLSMYATYLDSRGYRAVRKRTKTPDPDVSVHGISYLKGSVA